MKDCTLRSLYSKEVINVVTGERLGYIFDGDIDATEGRILSFCTAKACKKPFTGKKIIRKFSYDDIAKIGDDIILIRTCVCITKNPKKEL